jgi:hypothetical protein
LVGWLDLADEDRKRAKNYLANFRAEETVDELGFGVMRDAFSDLFFPATSTIMTRARYLIFIPKLCLKVEQERFAGERASQRMTELENDLRAALDRPEVEGVIGRRAKEGLRRFPSNVYWSSLKHLGIFLRPRWSQSYYFDHLGQFYEEIALIRDDDGQAHLAGDALRNWDRWFSSTEADSDAKFFLQDSEVRDSLDFDLTRAEANYLRQKFAELAPNNPSLLSHLISCRYEDHFTYPWDVPYPESMHGAILHAKCLSMAAKGATFLYYQMLLEARSAAGLSCPEYNLSIPFGLWWERTRDLLGSWNLEEFFRLMHGLGAVRPRDWEFFEQWLRVTKSSRTSGDLFSGQDARCSVRTRERTKRPRKARLAGGDQLRNWNPPDFAELPDFTDPDHVPYWLTYRSGIGGTFVREVTRGLSRKH